jgi:hypothetical protein
MAENDGIGLLERIAKLRWDMPRNGGVLAIGAALERLFDHGPNTAAKAGIGGVNGGGNR